VHAAFGIAPIPICTQAPSLISASTRFAIV
jgi:hypothetical protein